MSTGNRSLLLAGLWGLTLALAYLGPGELFASRIEGIDGSKLSLVPTLLFLAALAAALVVTLRAPRRAPGDEASGRHRRGFLVGGLKIAGGLGAVAAMVMLRLRGWLTVTKPAIVTDVVTTDPKPASSWEGARVRAYRRLGRTGFEVSDISLGSGRINEENDGESIARKAIERGVNYFDTAPDYSGHGSENALGRAMKGHRDRMFLATKFCTADGHLPKGSPVSAYIEAVEGSLRRLQTDWVDLVHIHSCDNVDRLLDPNVHEAFDRLKEQGKARFLGVSSHTPNLETVANAAIDSDRFDVMMLAYHHGAWPNLRDIIDRAAAKDMGIVAMKTLKGAKHHGLEGFRRDGDAYSQAAFKWVLSNPSVACLVISFYEHQHVDEYLAASGASLANPDLALLEKYDRLTRGTHCRQHCGACLDSCPENLPIDDVLRYRMYSEDYGWRGEGERLYAALGKKADVCIGCAAPCAGRCPENIAIRERMIGAHFLLS